MRFEQNTYLYLYKTPLDENYRNVYDDYEDYADYHNFLLNFQYIEIPITRVKSSMDNNGRFSIVIADFNSMNLHDYNYVEFVANGVRKFAFITSIQSQNDGPTSCSSQLSCKLDAWTNHYFELRNSPQHYPTTRCTYDNFYDIYYPTELQKYRFPTQRVFERSLAYHNGYFANGKRVVLWQKVLIGKNVHLGTSAYITPESDIQQTGGLIPIYRPVAVIDVDTRNPVPCNLTINAPTSAGSEPTTLLTLNLKNQPYYMIANVNGTYALDNTLTYMLPRLYDIQTTIVEGVEEVVITLDINGRYGAGPPSVGEGDERVAISNRYFFVCFSLNDKYSLLDSITVSMPQIPSISSRYDTSLTALARSEHYAVEYPFNYYSLIMNGQEYPLIPANTTNEVSTSFQIISYINDMMTRSIRVIKNVDDDKTIKPVINTNKLPTKFSQLEQYLAFNSNQVEQHLTNTAIRGTVGVATGLGTALTLGAMLAPPLAIAGAGIGAVGTVANMLTGTLGEYYQEKAKRADIANRPDVFNSTSPEAQYNMYYGDDVILVKNVVYYSPAVEDMFRSIHHNGIVTPKMLRIFSRRRDVFDVVAADASLKVQIANDDRIELESAIRTGITFWHINNYSQSQDRTDILMRMDKNVANLCVSKIPIGG